VVARPEQLFLTAVDDALESRRINKVDKLIRQAAFLIPGATVAEVDYRDGRGITPVRMRRYAAHDWRSDATNLLIISPTGGIELSRVGQVFPQVQIASRKQREPVDVGVPFFCTGHV